MKMSLNERCTPSSSMNESNPSTSQPNENHGLLGQGMNKDNINTSSADDHEDHEDPDDSTGNFLQKDDISAVNNNNQDESHVNIHNMHVTEGDNGSLESDIAPRRCGGKWCSVVKVIARFVALLGLLYFFICSLDLLSAGFKLLGGRAAGDVFGRNPLLSNPLCGLMIGVVATAFLQSSSTSTSIIITMVASGLLTVKLAIPMVMGANIGTSVTGVLVAVSQAGDRRIFRRAFSAATVHDMFNWLTVTILLPLEILTGYLLKVTSLIVENSNIADGGSDVQFLSVITKPFTDLVVQVDSKVLAEIARDNPQSANMSLLKYWCETEIVPSDQPGEDIYPSSDNQSTKEIGVEPCVYIFHHVAWSEQVVGVVVLIMSLVLLISCLIVMVKVLKSLLQGSMAGVIKKTINADFPGKAACLTGYVAILIGALVTVFVQSSSVVGSALTPLVGLGLVTVERVYPMMLGANIGTTSTALLAAFAASGDKVLPAFQISLCHLFFNLSGIIIWYPLPFMRKVPITMAKFLGKTTAKYRWFAVLYLLVMFFAIPLIVFALSIPGWYVLAAVGITVILIILTIAIITIIQKRKPGKLPVWLRTWDFLPKPLRSLEPLDNQITKIMTCCSCCACYAPLQDEQDYLNDSDVDDGKTGDDDDISMDSKMKDHIGKPYYNKLAPSGFHDFNFETNI